MKNKTVAPVSLLALVALIAVGGIAWWLTVRDDEPTTAAIAAPEDMAGMPGMEGMDMGGDGTVTLTAAQLDQFGITFGSVEERMLEQSVRTTGIVAIDETRVVRVAPKVSGFIERVYADYTGQAVRRGQALVELYSPELLAAQEELLLAARLAETLSDSGVPGVPASPNDVVGAARRRLRLLDVS